MTHPRAGQPAVPDDLIDVPALITDYYSLQPDPENPGQRVAFGTSGHRGCSHEAAFNDAHVAAMTQAICDYRDAAGIRGPLFLGRDSHALSTPAWTTCLEVLAANSVVTMIDAGDGLTPTPAISHAILQHNHRNHSAHRQQADGIVITPSHNPPRDGGFKYNPPDGGPAGAEITSIIQARANDYLAHQLHGVRRIPLTRALAADTTQRHGYLGSYVRDLPNVIDLEAIRRSGVRIGADPMGGASVDYWAAIAAEHGLDLTVINPLVDPTWRFMTLDWDGKIRMDCSSRHAMASLITRADDFSICTGNDADADRHGIVTPDAGLMNPNHFLAVSIDYLMHHRPRWNPQSGVGKTIVSSAMIDHVVAGAHRHLVEVPVGFKWFVPGLLDGTIVFGGEESAGGSFLRRDGSTWTTDKDGFILALLASEILAVTGLSPSEHYAQLAERYGAPCYARIDAPATRDQKLVLARLSRDQVTTDEVAGDRVVDVLTHAPGNGAAISGLKVTTTHGWFAARPSGTEDVYKIYAESFRNEEHLRQIQRDARSLVDRALGS